MNAYERLEAHHRRLFHLDHVGAIVGWDEATMMPRGGGPARADAMATLAELRHERACDPQVGELLDEASRASQAAQTSGALGEWQQANLRRMRRSWVRNTALPGALVGARTRARTRSEQAWRELRAANDWAGFRPYLEEVLALEREAAQALGQALSCAPYDALIDEFNPGLRQAYIDPIFAELAAFLPDFIERAVQASERRARVEPAGSFPVEQQRALCMQVMKALGFDFEHGRLDVSHHPFCGGVPRDVRITTRYSETSFISALMGLIHETGHGRYEQGLPDAWLGQPVGRSHGMAVHESQSLFFEMQLGRSLAFCTFLAPLVREAFPAQAAARPEAFTSENLHASYIHVERSLIRVDADEATYPTHVLLRYDIEKDLLAGRLQVADIPERWAEGMQRLLGLDTRGNDRDGCMQDVHWPAGIFGYFPSYTLGAIIAAQLFEALSRAVPDLDQSIARGELGAVVSWLSDAVWSQASRYELDELLQRATGAPLSARAYRAHLERRYLGG
jgi:carboxypeptidase Taq